MDDSKKAREARGSSSGRASFAFDDSSAITTSESQAGSSAASKSVATDHHSDQTGKDPSLTSLQRSQGDGAKSTEKMSSRAASKAPAGSSFRRLSSPAGDSSAALEHLRGTLAHHSRRRRQRHTDISDTGGVARAIRDDQNASADDGSVPDAPNPSPAGATSPEGSHTREGSSAPLA